MQSGRGHPPRKGAPNRHLEGYKLGARRAGRLSGMVCELACGCGGGKTIVMLRSELMYFVTMEHILPRGALYSITDLRARCVSMASVPSPSRLRVTEIEFRS